MHFSIFARCASNCHSFVISIFLLLIRHIDCMDNSDYPAASRIVGVYEKNPVICDDEYRSKYIAPELHKSRITETEFSSPEFLLHGEDASAEFMDTDDESPMFRRSFVPIPWNFSHTSATYDLEDDGDSQRRLLRDARGEEIGKIKRYTIHRTQITAGEKPGSLLKKLDSFFRHQKSNRMFGLRKSNRVFGLRKRISAKPYGMEDTFRSVFDSRRYSPGLFRKSLRQAGWSEDNCKSLRRIVGGYTLESPEELPFMVFVDTGCGGAIISDMWVLTAGHCVDEDDPKYVHTGSLDLLGGCQYNVVHVYAHPLFTRESLQYDVGLLKISPAFVFSPAIKPIRLSESKVRRKTCGIVAGWGAEAYRGSPKYKLKMTMIPVVSRKRCRKLGLKHGQFCAGYQDASSDACQGDSGGPFVTNGILVGIVSYGYKCATPNTPGVYVDVSYHRNWIHSIAGI